MQGVAPLPFEVSLENLQNLGHVNVQFQLQVYLSEPGCTLLQVDALTYQ